MAEERPTYDEDEQSASAEVPADAASADDPRQPSDGAPASAHDPAPEAAAAQAYHQRARLAEDRLAEVLSAYRTIKSENEGFQERIKRNLQRRFTQRHETLLLKFIDILDNLDRALEAAQRSYAGEPLLEGMILVRTQLLQRLQEEGLERIPVLGLPFDPAVSESVATHPVPDPEHDHVVVKELMRGYRVNGRVVRASQVVIGVYQEGAEPLRPAGPDRVADSVPANAAVAPAEAPAPPPPPEEPSIEEIVARAEAQLAEAREADPLPPPGKDAEEEEPS